VLNGLVLVYILAYISTMSMKRTQHLNRLLQIHKANTVLLAPYLLSNGISRSLQRKYCIGKWLESIGAGAFIRTGDTIDWQGALYSLQSQVDFAAHVGALTALTMQGRIHYVRFEERTFLFSTPKQQLPLWFKKQPWYKTVSFLRSNFITDDSLGKNAIPYKTFALKTSTPERAILEILYLTPKFIDWTEAYQLMEGLATLRPTMLQKLLMVCNSIRVKRLFLFMASKIGHTWSRHLDVNSLDLGVGKRSLVKSGVYVPDYCITVPKELVNL
jgi:hypothetical protein